MGTEEGSQCDSPLDIARVAAVSLLFHASLALEGIRLWAQERGFELPAQPESESCAVRWLCYSALLREANPPARVAAGSRHSVYIDGEGRLSSCGSAQNENLVLLGHGEGVTRLNTPTRLPSMLSTVQRVGWRVPQSGPHRRRHCLELGRGGFVQLGHGDQQH